TRITLVGSSQLRKKYTSVMSAVGSLAICGASRWLAAIAAVVQDRQMAASSGKSVCNRRFLDSSSDRNVSRVTAVRGALRACGTTRPRARHGVWNEGRARASTNASRAWIQLREEKLEPRVFQSGSLQPCFQRSHRPCVASGHGGLEQSARVGGLLLY